MPRRAALRRSRVPIRRARSARPTPELSSCKKSARRSAPDARNEDIAAIAPFPTRLDPHSPRPRRTTPVAGNPNVNATVVPPVAGDPDMRGRRPIPLHDDFAATRRRRFPDDDDPFRCALRFDYHDGGRRRRRWRPRVRPMPFFHDHTAGKQNQRRTQAGGPGRVYEIAGRRGGPSGHTWECFWVN